MNNKGLAYSLIAFMIILFVTAITSLLALTLWNYAETSFNNIDNETVSPTVKAKIDVAGDRLLGWGDNLFVIVFVIMLIAFIVSSVTLPVDQPFYLIIYLFVLIFIVICAMILSNGWAYIVNNPNFISAYEDLPFTDWFMKYLPYVVFFVGIAGSLLFYARRKTDYNNSNIVSGGGDAFE